MKIIKTGKHNIALYASVKEMPITVHNQLQNMLMQDSGIGSTMSDVDRHFSNLDMFLSAGKIEEAQAERTNLQLNIYSAINKINYKSIAFACFIHSINGKAVEDRTDEGLKSLIEKLNIPVGLIVEQLEDLKKNCITN